MEHDAPTVGSLFSGVGGLDLGFTWAGFRHAFFAEADPYCRAVLAARWPGVRIYDDVRDVARAEHIERVDVIAGGFPCQDLSVAGKRRGLDGERSGLFWEAMRVVDAFRPRAVVLENVEGLYTSNGGRDFGVVLDALATRGYVAAWRTLDAQFFGVPQRRRRVFVVGIADGDIGAQRIAQIFAFPQGSGGDSPTSDPAWPLSPRGIADGPSSGGGGLVGALTGRSPSRLDEQCVGGGAARRVVGTLTASYGEQTGQDFGPTGAGVVTSHDIARAERERERAIGVNPSNQDVAGTLPSNTQGGQRTTDIAGAYVVGVSSPNAATPDVAGTMTSRIGGSRTTDLGPAFVVGAYRKSARVNADPESAKTWVEDGIANTLNRFDVGDVRTTHAVVTDGVQDPAPTVRRLTPVECERLMGWPDGWTDVPWNGKEDAPDTRRYQACGNGVVSPVAYWIAARLREVLTDDGGGA